MAGLLDIFGTGGTETLGLLGMSPESIQGSRDDAQAQALYALAGRLFQGGGTGASIAQGLQQGQQAYKSAMQGQLQEQLQAGQLQELLRKRQLEQQALARQAQIERAVSGAYRPGVAGTPAQMVEEDGRYMGETPAVAGRAAGLDFQSLAPALMASPEGRKTLTELMASQKAMRPETFSLAEGAQQFERDPFTGQVVQVAAGAPKPEAMPTSLREFMAAQQNPAYGAFLTESKKPLVVMGTGQKGFENTTDLKKQFGGEPIYKEFAGMDTAYKQVTSAIKENSPIGDTAAATKIMKLLDPGSVVRETELGMAMAATGKMDRLKNYMDLYISGRKLTDTQRIDFQSLADQLYNAAATAYNEKRGEYEQIGKGFELNTDLALGKPAKVMTKPAAGGDLASQAAAELARRRSNQ